MQESVRESKANEVDCGQNTRGLFAHYVPDSSSWKTSQRSLFGGWIEFSETWPKRGLMRSGSVSRRPPLVPGTFVTEFLSLPLPWRFTTPDAVRRGQHSEESAKRRRARTGGGHRKLEDDVLLLGDRGPLNPMWVEWLMGFPLQWTELDVSATPSSRKSPNT